MGKKREEKRRGSDVSERVRQGDQEKRGKVRWRCVRTGVGDTRDEVRGIKESA
jgi:hypothetical protein